MKRVTVERAEEIAAKWSNDEGRDARVKDGVVQYRHAGDRRWTTSNIVTTGNVIHKFEAANLGKAPFRIARMEYRTYQACPGAPVQVGGSCDYCGTGIKETYIIADADGVEFKVGNQCVRKTGDHGLIVQVKKEEAKKRREKAEAKRQAKWKAEEDRETLAREALSRAYVRGVLATTTSPSGRGTALDYCDFMLGSQGMYPTRKAVALVLETSMKEE